MRRVATPMAITWWYKSGRPARVLEIGNSDPQDRCTYPDIDMIAHGPGYTHRDGTPYPVKE